MTFYKPDFNHGDILSEVKGVKPTLESVDQNTDISITPETPTQPLAVDGYDTVDAVEITASNTEKVEDLD